MTTRTSPTAQSVLAALDYLESASAATAMHLATPLASRVGGDVRRSGSTWFWRDAHVEVTDNSPMAWAQAAAALAAQGARTGDHWLDLTTRPGGWLKLMDSGVHTVAFGASHLGLPGIIAERGVPAEAIYAAADRAFSGDLELPSLLGASGCTVAVDGTPALVRLCVLTTTSDAHE